MIILLSYNKHIHNNNQTNNTHSLTHDIMSLSKTLQTKLDAIVEQYSDGETITLTVDELLEALTSSKSAPKKLRDPSKPRSPPTAFKRWKKNEGEDIRAHLEAESGQALSKRELNTYLSAMWADMTEAEQAAYLIISKVEQDEHKSALKTWKAESGIPTNPKSIYKKFNSSGAPPKAVAGWSAPKSGYIEGSPVDADTGKKFTRGFSTLEEAIEKADELGANGVTRTRVGFRVRIGAAVSSTEASRGKGEFSWVRM